MDPSNEDDASPEDVADILREQAEDEALARNLEEQAHTLLSPEIAEKIPPLYSQEEQGENAIVVVKFFTPWTNWTWYVSEYDPTERLCFGVIVGHEREYGYFSVAELEEIRGPGGLTIERDLYWRPRPLKECR